MTKIFLKTERDRSTSTDVFGIYLKQLNVVANVIKMNVFT